jgi:hypothetical protein
MSRTITKWLVEEVDSVTEEKVFSLEFDNYTEALETFNHLKEATDNNSVSIQKTDKRLLVE